MKNYVANFLHLLLLKITASEIGSILESHFQYILLMSISTIFTDGCIKKSAKFENIVDYTSSSQAIYDKVANLVKKNSRINIETIELHL